jgi:hypothetical protein
VCFVLQAIVIRFLHLRPIDCTVHSLQTCRLLSLSLPSLQLPTPLLRESLVISLPQLLPLPDALEVTMANLRSLSSTAQLLSVT